MLTMAVVVYWTTQVFAYLGHSVGVACGMAWFQAQRGRESEHSVAWPALTKAATTTIGSICLGALVVSPLTLLRTLVPIPPVIVRIGDNADQEAEEAEVEGEEEGEQKLDETSALADEDADEESPAEKNEKEKENAARPGGKKAPMSAKDAFNAPSPICYFMWGKMVCPLLIGWMYFGLLRCTSAILENLTRFFNPVVFVLLHTESKKFFDVSTEAWDVAMDSGMQRLRHCPYFYWTGIAAATCSGGLLAAIGALTVDEDVQCSAASPAMLMCFGLGYFPMATVVHAVHGCCSGIIHLFALNPNPLVSKYPRLYAAILVAYEQIHGREFQEKTYEE